MEIKITREELQKVNLMVATPMYGGMCNGSYTRSMIDLTGKCAQYGVKFTTSMLFNESLITRARSYIVDGFMRSDCTHLLFIDSDIGFDPNDVFALLALQMQNPEKYDVIGGPYPKKTISWEKIRDAVNRGAADKSPNDLENFVGDFVFNPVIPEGATEVRLELDKPIEVLEIGTGFMLIPRSTVEAWQSHFEDRKYLPDHVRTKDFDGSREIYLYFQAEIDPKSKRYLSEDYLWCQQVRSYGGKIWLCPWMHLTHTGSYIFSGNMTSMAQIGANPTADPSKVTKT